MAFDGIVTKSVVNELKNIIGYKIDKVYEPDKNTIVLGLYGKCENLNLLMCIASNNCRLHLTTHSQKNPLSAPNFCMLLRKHLIGQKIKNIYTLDLERIVFIELENNENPYKPIRKKLIVELMGKHSNIIIANENEIVIDSMRHTTVEEHSNRDIYPTAKYVFPKTQKYSFLELNGFDDFYSKIEPKLAEFIANQLNNINTLDISNFYIDKIISNTFNGISTSFVKNIIKTLNISDISKENLEIIYNTINAILSSNFLEIIVDNKDFYLSKNNSANNELNKSNYTDNEPYNSNYANNELNKSNYTDNEPYNSNYANNELYKSNYTDNEPYNSSRTNNELYKINYSIDNFYFEKESLELFKNYRNSILTLILTTLKKYEKRLENIDSKLLECSDMDKYRLYGELITANLYKLPNKNMDFIELENYYDNYNLLKIPLDKKYIPSINAKRFFKKYSKLKNAFDIVNIQKQDTIKEINYIESVIYEIESCKTIEDLEDIYEEISENEIFANKLKYQTENKKKKNKKAKTLTKNKLAKFNPLKYVIDGYTILVGRNNVENDYLTCKFANKNDIWFHTKDIHGSHVILKTNPNETIPENILYETAKLAAQHSKAKNSSHVPVDFCKVSFVKKPNGSKPGYVIYSNNKTLYV